MFNNLGPAQDFSHGFSRGPDQFPNMETGHISCHKQREPKRIGQSKVINEKPTKSNIYSCIGFEAPIFPAE